MNIGNTSHNLSELPLKARLKEQYLNRPLETLRTPALIIDRSLFEKNCAKMHERAKAWGASFRAHLKTHKTVEGTKLQLVTDVDRTNAVAVSTVMEAWQLVKAGLVDDSTVKDILYGLPISPNKIEDVSTLWDEVSKRGGIVRLLVDHPDQIRFLETFERGRDCQRIWSVFVKIDGGLKRAGVTPGSPLCEELLSAAFGSPFISVYGFYTHSGHSYASRSFLDASQFLSSEVNAVNTAAALGLAFLNSALNKEVHEQPFVLSIGSTPTAHAFSEETKDNFAKMLNGKLELHAGNYPMLDLQQRSTSMIDERSIAQKVIATVVSYYPFRGEGGTDEALIDAGAIAFSKDTGPSGGYGEILGTNWRLGRISQEHGILVQSNQIRCEKLELGSMVEIVGQHACLTAAAHPWYYIVDKNVEGGRVVVDIWVPWKGW